MTRRTRGEPASEQSPPGFSELAPQLSAELEAYLSSCLDDFDARTPRLIKKCPITCEAVRRTVAQLAGYTAYELDLPAELLDLRELCQPTMLRSFIPWWLRRRKRSTGGLRIFLRTMRTIAEHHLHDLALAQEISALYDMLGLPPEEPMCDAEPPWLDLEELDLIGQSRYPLNERRLQDSPYAQEVAYYLAHPDARPPKAYRQHPQGSNLKMMAVWAEHALMIRLWVHRPLRQRNMRERASEGADQGFFAAETTKGLRLLEITGQHYDVVLTNPPYMTSRNMNAVLKEYLQKEYPLATSDLYAAFIQRCTEWLADGGRLGMITQQSFMFISSYGKLREFLRQRIAMETMPHVGPRAFEEVTGEKVNTTLFVFRREPNAETRNDSVGTYLRLVKEPDGEAKRRRFELALPNLRSCQPDPIVFHYRQGDFDVIPASPWVYWLNRRVRVLFCENRKLSDIGEPRAGMHGGDRFRFARY